MVTIHFNVDREARKLVEDFSVRWASTEVKRETAINFLLRVIKEWSLFTEDNEITPITREVFEESDNETLFGLVQDIGEIEGITRIEYFTE
jgi:hypothetical protein